MSEKVMVVGARPGSLGAAVVKTFFDRRQVCTAGLRDGYEPDHVIDVANDEVGQIVHVIAKAKVKHVVCTVGINESGPFEEPFDIGSLRETLDVNVIGVMNLLLAWIYCAPFGREEDPAHFVVISSNSAHVARRNSLAYCASKAALSMAVRCAARDHGGADKGLAIYCYEPGLLATPQTAAVAERMPGQPLHRIPNNSNENGFDTEDLAGIIVNNIWRGTAAMLNGTCIRVDGGEQ